MASIHKLPSLDQAKHEASEWIARLDADDATDEDRAGCEEWRSANQINARAFDELSATYQEFAAAGPFVRAVSFAQSMSAEVARPRSWRMAALGAGAVLVLLVILTAHWYRSASPLAYRTAIGEHATVSLPDGSTLELNSASGARVEYESGRRVIRLEQGEGYFKVVHDPQRPFWVVAGHSWVRAVGTAFNVYLRPGGVEVTVSEGTVSVGSSEPTLNVSASGGQEIAAGTALVRAGQQAELRGTTTATRALTSMQLASAVAWREGLLYFEDQPLSDVSAEIERYSTIRFVLEGDAVRQLRVGGTFQASPQGAETLMTMLERGFGLQVQREADRVYVRSQSEATHP